MNTNIGIGGHLVKGLSDVTTVTTLNKEGNQAVTAISYQGCKITLIHSYAGEASAPHIFNDVDKSIRKLETMCGGDLSLLFAPKDANAGRLASTIKAKVFDDTGFLALIINKIKSLFGLMTVRTEFIDIEPNGAKTREEYDKLVQAEIDNPLIIPSDIKMARFDWGVDDDQVKKDIRRGKYIFGENEIQFEEKADLEKELGIRGLSESAQNKIFMAANQAIFAEITQYLMTRYKLNESFEKDLRCFAVELDEEDRRTPGEYLGITCTFEDNETCIITKPLKLGTLGEDDFSLIAYADISITLSLKDASPPTFSYSLRGPLTESKANAP